jgi:hypothetical protein
MSSAGRAPGRMGGKGGNVKQGDDWQVELEAHVKRTRRAAGGDRDGRAAARAERGGEGEPRARAGACGAVGDEVRARECDSDASRPGGEEVRAPM